jgi:hypothetical protein
MTVKFRIQIVYSPLQKSGMKQLLQKSNKLNKKGLYSMKLRSHMQKSERRRGNGWQHGGTVSRFYYNGKR